MTTEELISLINHTLGAGTAGLSDIPSNPACLTVFPEKLPDVCRLLHHEDKTLFDLLECITGIDNGLENGTMEVIYHLYSIVYDQQLALRIILPRTTVTGDIPEVPSVSGIWKTAEWLERETYDLMGIKFMDHPDLRRILLPADWKGHPLRKDYQDAEYYHGVKIKY